MEEDHRIERDSLGEVAVPVDAYWGAQTQRAVENFPISGLTFDRRFIAALGLVKQSAARANRDLDLLDETVADAIEEAAAEVIAGEHDDQFPVDIFQTGSGTSSNMNANEVIANRAAELLGEPIGSKAVHPNDHVNFGQSSNDVIPTAMHIAARLAIDRDVFPALEGLAASLESKAAAFDDVVKTGRTHLQDATPVRLGQEFAGYQAQINLAIDRVDTAGAGLYELAIGGTATGTGLNTHPSFSERVCAYVEQETQLPFREAGDHFEAQAAHDAMGHAHAGLRTAAGALNKMANDLRLLASGPRNGLGEIEQPENQPGSSIMPGKINPVIAEAVNQVHKQILGNDTAMAVGASRGELELNLYKPLLAHNFLESARLLSNAASVFAERFIDGLEADRAHCAEQVEQSMALATALNPHIGYDKAADAAKTALKEGKSVRAVAIEKGYVTAEEAETILDVYAMTEPGIIGDE